MSTVSDILRAKGRTVHRVPADASVHDAVQAMVRHDIGALVITDGLQPAGLFTERDYLRRVVIADDSAHKVPVETVMATHVICISPNTPVDECMQIMTERRVRHLPVVHDARLVGIVSIGDIVKWLIRDQATYIQSLTHYIQGRA